MTDSIETKIIYESAKEDAFSSSRKMRATLELEVLNLEEQCTVVLNDLFHCSYSMKITHFIKFREDKL